MTRRNRHSAEINRPPPVLAGRDANGPAPADHVPAPLELLLKVLPELSVVGIALVAAFTTGSLSASLQDMLLVIAVVEGAFAMAQAALTDLATRLKKPPPWWSVPLVLAGIVVFFPDTRVALALGQEAGWSALVGIAWSVAERLRELWTMPRASRLEKMRRRALVGGRIGLLLLFGFAMTALMLGSLVYGGEHGGVRMVIDNLAWFIAAYFSLTAIDVVRVHREAFARRPRTLLRFDPLGVDYLGPL